MSDTDVRGLQDLPLEELVACHECDLLMRREPLGPGEKANCPRCGFELAAHRHQWKRRCFALVLTALFLYIPANFLPIDGSVGSPHVRVGHRQAPIPKPLVSDDRGFCFCARKKACFLFTLPKPSWHVLFRV